MTTLDSSDSDIERLRDGIERAWEIALKFGLDPFPTHFELVPATIMYEFASYGLPGRFSHWTHGKAYHRMKMQYDFGLSKIYEMVINTNPSYAFLMEMNNLLQNTFVAAHVFGHTDFFKNNAYFQHTSRRMIDKVGIHAERIAKYEFDHGNLPKARGYLDGTNGIGRLQGTHGNHQWAMENACGNTRYICAEHWHVHATGYVAHLDAVFDQRLLEGERTTNRKAHKVVAPDVANIGGFRHQLAIAPYAVSRQIRAYIQIGSQCGKAWVARFRYSQHRAWLRIGLRKPQEVVRQGTRKNNQVGLHVSGRQARRLPMICTLPDTQPFTRAGIVMMSCYSRVHGPLRVNRLIVPDKWGARNVCRFPHLRGCLSVAPEEGVL